MADRKQNQGLQVAIIVFVILTVVSTGSALLTSSNVRELRIQAETERKRAAAAEQAFADVQAELDVVKELIGLQPQPDTQQMPDLATTFDKFSRDLKKYGARLQAVLSEMAPPADYSQSLDAVLHVVEQRNSELAGLQQEIAQLRKEKAVLAATYDGHVVQYRRQTHEAEQARAYAQLRAADAEEQKRRVELQLVNTVNELRGEINQLQLDTQLQLAAHQKTIEEQQATIRWKDEIILQLQPQKYATTFDGRIARVNPQSRTVWIDVGSADLLPLHLSLSVQPTGVAAGSPVSPKGRIEVTKILDDHLAECRIVDDDLSDPILIDDQIFTPLWDRGRRTHFAFAGRIDLDDDGGDDLERLRTMVDRAAGQIDAVAKINGETEGKLLIETRYLVLGSLPADKAGIAAYQQMLEQAERYGIQRVSLSLFLDMIGHRRSPPGTLIVWGTDSAEAHTYADRPDGFPRVSIGSVSRLFQQRRPPAAVAGSAY